ncbi:MAG: MGMT family protein [Planctomycetes bacterium]|nr:MGMT family protein [Planctomycetota bacterium]
MARKKKSWIEKLDAAKAKEDLPKTFYCDKAKQQMLVPSPAHVEQEIRRIRKSRIRTIKQVTDKLAAEHGVDVCCPMTTGIFAWIIAHANHEMAEQGRKRIVPWWRLVKSDGQLNPKYPGAGLIQKAKLEEEGRTIRQKGKNLLVEGVN